MSVIEDEVVRGDSGCGRGVSADVRSGVRLSTTLCLCARVGVTAVTMICSVAILRCAISQSGARSLTAKRELKKRVPVLPGHLRR